MSFWSEIRWFQRSATAIFVLFVGVIVFVIIAAYSRKSGGTGLDMGKVQQMRYQANQEQALSENP